MSRFIKSNDRFQSILFAETLDDYIEEENSVRVIEAFIEELDLSQLGFQKTKPLFTDRPGYDPACSGQAFSYQPISFYAASAAVGLM